MRRTKALSEFSADLLESFAAAVEAGFATDLLPLDVNKYTTSESFTVAYAKQQGIREAVSRAKMWFIQAQKREEETKR